MIKVQTLDLIENIEHIVVPTIFPDGTSQVWKLPESIITSQNVKITWNFESEAELMHLASLRDLLSSAKFIHLHIPFLPYGRQDKSVSNHSTFNLTVFTRLINTLDFDLVTAVDGHNPIETNWLTSNFKNIGVEDIIKKLISDIKIDGIIYPDLGAYARYGYNLLNNGLCCEKKRNQLTGELLGHTLIGKWVTIPKKILIIDDICDGGATFISIAKLLTTSTPNVELNLYVTHGIFSKGKQVLYDAGIKNIYTTNSLLKNADGFKV